MSSRPVNTQYCITYAFLAPGSITEDMVEVSVIMRVNSLDVSLPEELLDVILIVSYVSGDPITQ